MIDQTRFRHIMGRFATGVTVVTARHNDRDYGMTLSALTSLRLEPPMLVICVNQAAPTHDAIRDGGAFVANILAEHQERLARQFARPADNKFASVATIPSALGPQIIAGTLAHISCRVTDQMAGGTHTIFLGEAIDAQATDTRNPLLYYSAGFGRFDSSSRPRNSTPAYLPPELADDLATVGVTPGPLRLGLFYTS